MRPKNSTLTARQVHRCAAAILQDHLKLPDHGPKCRAGPLLTLLFYAAARITSLSAACKCLRDAPSDEAARLALLATLPDFAELQRRLNAALAGDLPRPLRRRRAAPGHRPGPDPLPRSAAARPRRDLPRPGQERHQPLPRLRHRSTSIHRGCRFTVALTAVKGGEPLEEVLKRLLRQAAAVGVRCRLLLLDRGFYSVGVIRYLQAARHPFLMPVICRGRKADDPRGPSGTNVFLTLGEERLGHLHPARRPRGGRPGCRSASSAATTAAQWRRHGKQRLVYAFWGLKPPSFDWVKEMYRQRFAIETTYRQIASGADPDDDARPGAAAVVRGDRVDPAERVGVVAPDGAGPAPARESRDPPGLAPLPPDVVVVGPCGGAEARRPRLRLVPTVLTIKDCGPR